MEPERLEKAIKLIQKKGVYKYDVLGKDSEGNRRWLHSTITPLQDEKGEQVGYILNSRDVTQYIEAGEALRESQERLKALYKGIPVPTYTWQKVGEDFVLTNYNDAAMSSITGNIKDLMGIKAKERYKDS